MEIAIIGSGLSGLTAARHLTEAGHHVVVLDKGRRPGGRMATRELMGGGRADTGAQFFTVRSAALAETLGIWMEQGLVQEWCRGFTAPDGHPRYAVRGGMAELGAHLASGLDVRQSIRVDRVARQAGRWRVTWGSGHAGPAGGIDADAVVVTSPVPQTATLLADGAEVPDLTYEATLSLIVALDGPGSVPTPGGVQLAEDPVWSWVGDNLAKGTSNQPTITLHSTTALAAARFDEDESVVLDYLCDAARPWLGEARITDAQVQRWRFATPVSPWPERCLEVTPGVILAGDAFGGPRVEGAYLSGVAAAEALS